MKVFQKRPQMMSWYILGFLLGILGANLFFKFNGISESISKFCQYSYIQDETGLQKEYFFYLIFKRGSCLVIPFFVYLTQYKKPITGIILMWTGFSTGIILVVSIIDKGIYGIILCFAALFPHVIFYFMSYYIIMKFVYEYPNIKWTALKTIFVVVFLITGAATETVINPFVYSWLIHTYHS